MTESDRVSETALAALRRIFGEESGEQSVPEVIYHYCPIEAFKGIVESGELWLSHHASMNDVSDTTYFFDLLVQEFRSISDTLNEKQRSVARSFLEFYQLNQWDYFIASFSSEPDILSQWVMYTNNGHGVCIGFYSSDFRMKRYVPHFSTSVSDRRGMFPVRYTETTAREKARACIELAVSEVFGKSFFSTGHLSLSTKHQGFANEKEIRIVEINGVSTPINPDWTGLQMRNPSEAFLYRSRGKSEIVMYRKLQFRDADHSVPHHLHSLLIGPQSTIDGRMLGPFLQSHNVVVDNPIRPSDIPYYSP